MLLKTQSAIISIPGYKSNQVFWGKPDSPPFLEHKESIVFVTAESALRTCCAKGGSTVQKQKQSPGASSMRQQEPAPGRMPTGACDWTPFFMGSHKTTFETVWGGIRDFFSGIWEYSAARSPQYGRPSRKASAASCRASGIPSLPSGIRFMKPCPAALPISAPTIGDTWPRRSR